MTIDKKQKPELLSRRDFLRNLSLGTIALATGVKINAQESLAQNKGRKLGIALLGLGKYSTGQLAPALLQTRLCYLAGVVTDSQNALKPCSNVR